MLGLLSPSIAQDISNEGMEFWTVFPSHLPADATTATLAKYRLYITSRSNSSGVVNIGSTLLQTFTVTPNSMTEIDIPRNLAYLDDNTGTITGKGIQILVNPGQAKIVVYAHIYASARSGATLLLPVEGYGTTYYVMQHGEGTNYDSNGYKSYQIVAGEANTSFLIYQRINGAQSTTIALTLTNVGDTYQFLSKDDYTGTRIDLAPSNPCAKFTVFSGSSASAIPISIYGSNSWDPLFQQLYPINYWGKDYAYVPFFGPDQGNIIRILAQEDNTKVQIGNIDNITLNKGQYYTSITITTAQIITANKPISVAQFALTQWYADSRNTNLNTAIFSDPDMVILNPIELNIKDIVFFSTNKENIVNRFINVVMKTTAIATFRVDGIIPTGTFMPINSSAYSYLQLDLTLYNAAVGIRLTADEGFNAISYGFGKHESYAYSAGTNILTKPILTELDITSQKVIYEVCINNPFDFKLTLPYYNIAALEWQLDGDTVPTIMQINPTYEPTIGSFDYFLRNASYMNAGNKAISITVRFHNTASGCPIPSKTYLFSFSAKDAPLAQFDATKLTSLGDQTFFSDKSISHGSNVITEWFWDFGDGQHSSSQNPTHIYSASGSYTATLIVTAAFGCSAIIRKVIKVVELPVLPRIITANNDGINDDFLIEYLDSYPEATMDIYDRRGTLVFKFSISSFPWTGLWHGKNLPVAAYYYVIYLGNGHKPLTGYVALMK